MKGLRKLGYTGRHFRSPVPFLLHDLHHIVLFCIIIGGPVMSDKEAAGIRFGLHRSGFNQGDFHSIKLLVGMEVCDEPLSILMVYIHWDNTT